MIWRWLRRTLMLRLCLTMLFMTGDAPHARALSTGLGQLLGGAIQQAAQDAGWSFVDTATGQTLEYTIEAVGEAMFAEGATTWWGGGPILATAAATAPEWLPLLLVGGAVAGAAVAIGAGYYWLTSSNGQVMPMQLAAGQVEGAPVPAPPSGNVSDEASWINCAAVGIQTAPTSVCPSVGASAGPELAPPVGFSRNTYSVNDQWSSCSGYPEDVINCMTAGAKARFQNTRGYVCDTVFPSGMGFMGGNGSTGSNPGDSGSGHTGDLSFELVCVVNSMGQLVLQQIIAQRATTGVSVTTAANGVPTSAQQAAIDPQLVANSINKAWQSAAAKPGYQGVPFTAPVTATEVQTVAQTLPTTATTVGSALQTVPTGTTSWGTPTVGLTAPAATGVATTTNGGTTTQSQTGNCNGTNDCNVTNIDLGTDPGVAQPTLEQTPLATDMVSSLSNLLPGLTKFQVPAHSATCPTATITIFGQTYVMDQQCTLFEGMRSQIATVFVVIWSIIAAFIILSA